MPAAPLVGAVTTRPPDGVLLVHGERECAEPLARQFAAPVGLGLVELLADRAARGA